MRRPIRSIIITASVLLLAGCSGGADDNQVADTQMADLDSLEGTISDDMINTDESTDEAPVDAPVDASSAATTPEKAEGPKPKLDPAAAKETGGPLIVKIEPEPATE